MIPMSVYVIFLVLDSGLEKIIFANLANPKNPNLNLDCTDQDCEIRLLHKQALTRRLKEQISLVLLAR